MADFTMIEDLATEEDFSIEGEYMVDNDSATVLPSSVKLIRSMGEYRQIG